MKLSAFGTGVTEMEAAKQGEAKAAAQRWRAIYCKPRQEARAHAHLENQGYTSFLPLVRNRRRIRGRDQSCIEPMFPRYLFIALADYRENWAPIRSTRGVVGLVRMGEEVPTVPHELIAALQAGLDETRVFDLTSLQRWKRGEVVEITAGPFCGYRGIFDAASGQRRAMILLEILNTQRRIEIPLQDFKRA